MNEVKRGLAVLMLLAGLVSCATSSSGRSEAAPSNRAAAYNATGDSGSSYYGTLQSLIGPKRLKVRPKPDGRDFNLIRPEKGAAGMQFGDSMDAVVDTWGKPSGIDFWECPDIWRLRVGACVFGFVEGHLAHIGVCSATLPDAYLENGISFKSSFEEVVKAFGQPIEERPGVIEFETAGGYGLEFQFVGNTEGVRKLIAITISSPESRE